MKKIIQIVLFLVLILVIALPQAGAEEEEQELAVDARSAILMEPTTLEVIYEKNPDEKLAPASLTKIMTLILVYEALEKGLISKDTVLTASESVRGIEGTRIFLDVGERMKVEDLLKSIAIGSANDAAVVCGSVGRNVANFAKNRWEG